MADVGLKCPICGVSEGVHGPFRKPFQLMRHIVMKHGADKVPESLKHLAPPNAGRPRRRRQKNGRKGQVLQIVATRGNQLLCVDSQDRFWIAAPVEVDVRVQN
jgi:hypothetical protein